MKTKINPLTQKNISRRPIAGITVMLVCVGVTTTLIFPLREFAPVLSTGVVYLISVIIISSQFGAFLGVLTAFLSAAAFNWFHIPPTGRFTIAESENWVALVVFLVAAGFVSSLASQGRARAQEAFLRNQEVLLLATMSQLVFDATNTTAALEMLGNTLAKAFQLTGLSIQLNPVEEMKNGRDHQYLKIPLATTNTQAFLALPNTTTPADVTRIRQRILPSLAALIDGLFTREELVHELIETQAIRESEHVKTAVLRALSHDLRSPLTAITTACESLQHTRDEKNRDELLEIITIETQRLTRLIDQLITLAKIEAGQAKPNTRQCILEDVILAAAQSTGKPATSFSMELEPKLPTILADPYHLERAIANLMENAIKHSRDQHVTIVARAQKAAVEIRVIDRGDGVPAHLHDVIFQPFKQVTSAQKNKHKTGVGLGLAIAKGFVEANKGTLTLDSLPGQGSVFTITLPLPTG